MADLSKIKVGSTTYDIKDATARANIATQSSQIASLQSDVSTQSSQITAKADKTAITNPNLLDNPWFTVNQRGVTSWNNVGTGIYTVDRWKVIGTFTGNIANGIVTITAGTIAVPFEIKPLLGKTVTFSVMLSDGSIKSTTGTIPNTVTTTWASLIPIITDINAGLSSYTTTDIAVAYINSGAYKAVKLELGSVSTLAMDTAPDYATELLKCQRYFYTNTSRGDVSFIAYNNQQIFGTLNFPVKMRVTPSVSLQDNLLRDNNQGTTVTVTSINFNVSASGIGGAYGISPNLTAQKPYGMIIVASADL